MSNKNQSVLEINGNRYDASTGALLSDVVASAGKQAKKINDVVKPKPGALTKATPKSQPMASKKVMDVRRTHAKPVQAHQPQHANTLMRTAVKKPASGIKRHAKATTSTDVLAKVPTISIVPKWSFHNIDPEKRRRAQHIARSHLIRKFAPQLSSSTPATASAAVASHAPVPVSSDVIAPKQSLDVFQRALAHADAHEQPPFKLKHPRRQARAAKKAAKHAAKSHKPAKHWGRRIASVTSIALAVAVLSGFIAYQNRTNLTLHIASVKAGFDATLPAYHPSGFAVGKFQYGSGYVAINFSNASSQRSYSINQKSSNWDSETLLDNFVAANNKSYQTIVNAGRTIYLYGDNNASWMDNGVWYQVNSNGNLSSTDVLNIASSL